MKRSVRQFNNGNDTNVINDDLGEKGKKKFKSLLEETQIAECAKCNYYKTYDVFTYWNKICDDCVKKENELNSFYHKLGAMINPPMINPLTVNPAKFVKTPNTFITTKKVNDVTNLNFHTITTSDNKNIKTTLEKQAEKQLIIAEQQIREYKRQNYLLEQQLYDTNYRNQLLQTQLEFLENTNEIMRRDLSDKREQNTFDDYENNIDNIAVNIAIVDSWLI